MQQTTHTPKDNPMRAIKVEKITLNIGTGMPGEVLDKALKLLQKVSQSKPVPTTTKKRIPTWGVRPGLTIGAKVTIRRKKAEELLARLLKAKNNILPPTCFDNSGNLAFGIPEYIDVPGVEYDSSIGIIGFEAAVTLMRPGYRIKSRARKSTSLTQRHRISKQEAIRFMEETFKTRVQ